MTPDQETSVGRGPARYSENQDKKRLNRPGGIGGSGLHYNMKTLSGENPVPQSLQDGKISPARNRKNEEN